MHPKHRLKFCPACGADAFQFDGNRSFLCRNCAFHFFLNSAAAVAGIIENQKGEVLLTQRAFEPCKGMWDLPGGFVDPGESAEQALIREIREELNLEVTQYQYLFSSSNEYVFSKYTVYTTDLAFRCKVLQLEPLATNDDVSSAQFMNLKQLDWASIGFQSVRQLLKRYCDEKH